LNGRPLYELLGFLGPNYPDYLILKCVGGRFTSSWKKATIPGTGTAIFYYIARVGELYETLKGADIALDPPSHGHGD
jgi:hypothetical protein